MSIDEGTIVPTEYEVENRRRAPNGERTKEEHHKEEASYDPYGGAPYKYPYDYG